MSEQNVTCPNCGHEFELGRALTDKLASALRSEMNEQFQAEQRKLAAETKQKAKEEIEVELTAAHDALKEKSDQLRQANQRELEFRKRERQLKDEKESQELEIQKRIDSAREKIAKEAVERAAEEQQLRFREKENLIQSLRNQVGDLKRRMEVGSQESQGEALEEELVQTLRSKFPFDEFEEIKKGQRGADILQKVRNQTGAVCGTIVWESKNTKAFSRTWLDKLKEDRQRVGADLAVLVSTAMPPETQDFGPIDEIWVARFKFAVSLCDVLRELLMGVHRATLVSANQGEVKDLIYRYVTGQEFIGRVKRIASAYAQMQSDLDQEKRAMERIWKKREKQIQTVIDNLSGMHGELEGLLVGESAALPDIEVFSLGQIGNGEGEAG